MAFAAIGGPPIYFGPTRQGVIVPVAMATAATMDATNEAVIFYGRVWNSDQGSHTIDTSGSSALQWRNSGSATFANGGTTLKIGLADVDATANPPARAVAASDVITFDVEASLVGGTDTITLNAWHSTVPESGSKTIAHGDLVAFCFQMTARAGADSVGIGAITNIESGQQGCTSFVGGAYANTGDSPNVVIVYSDGALGFIEHGNVAEQSFQSVSFQSGSAQNEYGNVITLPFGARCRGWGVAWTGVVTTGTNFDLVIYSDPLGTPVAQKTLSVDAGTLANSSGTMGGHFLLPDSFAMAANTAYAFVMKATTATNVTIRYKRFNDAAHRAADHLGTNCVGVRRGGGSGAFADINSSKDVVIIGPLIDAFETGSSGGGHILGGTIVR